MQDTETPTTKPQGRGKSSNSILSADICLLYVVLRMQTCCSGVCRTYTPPDLGAPPQGHQIKSRESEHASNLGPLGQSSVHDIVKNRCLHCYHVCKIPRLRPLSHRAGEKVRTLSCLPIFASCMFCEDADISAQKYTLAYTCPSRVLTQCSCRPARVPPTCHFSGAMDGPAWPRGAMYRIRAPICGYYGERV